MILPNALEVMVKPGRAHCHFVSMISRQKTPHSLGKGTRSGLVEGIDDPVLLIARLTVANRFHGNRAPTIRFLVGARLSE
jgi:hypothetical protein